jgi:hypothetical protein
MSALVLLLNVIVASVHGQSANNWNCSSNTSWGTATNWILGSVPNNTNTLVQIGTAERSIAVQGSRLLRKTLLGRA